MKLLKAHPILTIPNAYLIDSPAPSNLSYIWSFGSLLGTCLVLQIITGVTLAFHYVSSVDLAFSSVEHLTRDVTNGWLIRFLHANGAAFFFIFVYLHIGKAIYYGSYRSPRVLLWSIGVVIFLVMIVTAFLGYVLPFHQMSYWAGAVITNLLSALPWIGKDLVEFSDLENMFIYSSVLPTIGTVNSKALHRATLRTENDKRDALNISYSFLSMLMGLIDGDGYLSITKTPAGYIRIQLIISLDMRELELIKYIHSVLKVGRIDRFPKINTVKLVISRTDLQIIVFPLILHHNLYFLTDTRRAQFDKVMFILLNGIKKYSELPIVIPVYNKLPETAEGYTKLPFFLNWIVGFTIAEG